ncbi:MAG: hypothetical protein RLY86_3931 [Pseudomonadota bacterium]|jgi:molybdate transport system substrate-binding protein
MPSRPTRRLASSLLAGLALVLVTFGVVKPGLAAARDGAARAGAGLTVFAAASLKTAMEDAAAAYKAETGVSVTISAAGSPALARQIEAGAPADLFISADQAWMDHLQARGLIRAETRADLLGNRLVLVAAPGEGAVDLEGLPGALGDRRLAVAHVEAVPAGRYAKAALAHFGLWPTLAGRLAQAENVRAALALVARGEAPYGIVYATDSAEEPLVTVAAAFPPGSHPPILYPAAVTSGSGQAEAAGAFLAWLSGPRGAALFRARGFTLPGDGD